MPVPPRFARATAVILLAVLVAFFVAGQADATSIRVTLAQLSASSPLVVRGNVERIDSAWTPDRRIESTVYVRVSEALRGDLAAGGLIPVLIEGGRVGRIAMFSSEDPTFTVGEDVLIFLNADETGALRVTDNAQGKFKISDYQAINEAWRQQTAVESLEDALREQKLKIVALAPCGADCAGTTVVPGVDTPAYQWNGERWCDSNPMSEVYLVNPTGGFQQAIINGANSWSQAGAKFAFRYGGSTSISDDGFDGVNELHFANLGSNYPSTLGLTRWWSDGSCVFEADVIFNTRFSWSMNPGSGQVDVESVAVHEFGHWLVLGHDTNPTAVMYAGIGYGQIRRSLSSSDVAGIQAIYGLGGVPAAITDLSITVAGADAKLSWTNPSANTSTQVLSSNSNPYFPPSTGLERGIYPLPIATWNDTGVLVDTNASTVYYIVLGRLGTVVAAPSRRVGLFEFTLLRGN